MTLADYTFQFNSGVILNLDAALPFVDVTRVTGLDNAPFRETIRDHEGVDGGYIDAEFEQGREIVVEGTAYCDVSIAEVFFDSLKANYAPVTTPLPFVFKAPGVNERVVFVKPRGARYDWDTARRYGASPIQILMYAEDPRIYDNSLVSQVIPYGGAATTGFAFNMGFNLSFGTTVPPDGQYVVNAGNRPTPAILTIQGPVTNPRIVNDTDGKTLRFVIDLAVSDQLVIDLANHTVTLNGVTNRRDSLQEPNWFLFNPGTPGTFIRFGGTSGSGTLTVSYRNAWR
jgi:tail protein